MIEKGLREVNEPGNQQHLDHGGKNINGSFVQSMLQNLFYCNGKVFLYGALFLLLLILRARVHVIDLCDATS